MDNLFLLYPSLSFALSTNSFSHRPLLLLSLYVHNSTGVEQSVQAQVQKSQAQRVFLETHEFISKHAAVMADDSTQTVIPDFYVQEVLGSHACICKVCDPAGYEKLKQDITTDVKQDQLVNFENSEKEEIRRRLDPEIRAELSESLRSEVEELVLKERMTQDYEEFVQTVRAEQKGRADKAIQEAEEALKKEYSAKWLEKVKALASPFE